MTEEETYDGIGIADLRVDSVSWTPAQAEHVRTRSGRYPGAFDIEPEWATEAALNPGRRFGLDPASKSGEGIRVIGRSEAAGRALTVILIPEEHPPAGAWPGVTAWAARGRDLREHEAHEIGYEAGDEDEAEGGGTSR